MDPELGSALEQLYLSFDRSLIAPDPLELVLGYSDPHDQEVAGLLVSALAYGRVEQIIAGAARTLQCLGPSPARFANELASGVTDRLEAFEGLVHRLHRGGDLGALCWFAGEMRRRHGSLGTWLLKGGWPEDGPRGLLLTLHREWAEGDWVERVKAAAPALRFGDLAHLLPDPGRGSACKRLQLWLRWMVRRDQIDPGPWVDLLDRPPGTAPLLIPLDTHVARIASYIGLTDRRTPSWRMAEEVTSALAVYDPRDPVKYDFALCRLGILDRCPTRRDPGTCRDCAISRWCRLPLRTAPA